MQTSLLRYTAFACLLAALSVGCSPDKEQVLAGIHACERLSVLECHFSKAILAQKQNNFARDDYYYAKVVAKVKYELDCRKIAASDLSLDGDKIHVRIPKLETTTIEDLNRSVTVDSAAASPFEYFGHLLRPRREKNQISRTEKDSLRADALRQIHQLASADTSSLRIKGAAEADSLLRSILSGLGYAKENIKITVQ